MNGDIERGVDLNTVSVYVDLVVMHPLFVLLLGDQEQD
jgi:hypothetical protein